MRKVLMALLALGGAAGATQQAHADVAVGAVAALDRPALVQTVQYYDDWRRRQYNRREVIEQRQHQRQERRVQRHERGHGYIPPAHGGGLGYNAPH